MMNKLTVVIPVKDSEKTLKRCLESLMGDIELLHEIVVVDDGSSDQSIEIAKSFQKIRIVQTDEKKRGVARARNKGAREATGDIVLFIDADIELRSGSISILKQTFEDETVNAAVGLLDPDSEYKNFASDYKNLWMHYTYKIQPQETSLFYTSIAAIRREVFLELGGFDVEYKRPGLEDTAFGNTLYRQGHSARLVPELLALHIKYYTTGNLLKLDFERARALVMIQLRRGFSCLKSGNRSSVPLSFILSIVPGFLTNMLFVVTLLFQLWFLLLPTIVMGVIAVLLNAPFLWFLFRERGFIFLFKAKLFVIIDSIFLVSGIVVAFIEYLSGKRY